MMDGVRENKTEAEEAKCTKKRKRDYFYYRKDELQRDHKERHVHFTHNKRENSAPRTRSGMS